MLTGNPVSKEVNDYHGSCSSSVTEENKIVSQQAYNENGTGIININSKVNVDTTQEGMKQSIHTSTAVIIYQFIHGHLIIIIR